MEKMKINSKTGYRRNRVKNGYGPHKMLEMIQQKGLEKLANNEGHKKDSDSSLKAEEIPPSRQKITEVEK